MKQRIPNIDDFINESLDQTGAEKAAKNITKTLKKLTKKDIVYGGVELGYKDDPTDAWYYLKDTSYPQEFLDMLSIIVNIDGNGNPNGFFISHDATPYPLPGHHSKSEEREMLQFLCHIYLPFNILNAKVFNDYIESIWDSEKDDYTD